MKVNRFFLLLFLLLLSWSCDDSQNSIVTQEHHSAHGPMDSSARQISKDLVEDMRAQVVFGFIKFEIYDESDRLIRTLDKESDLTPCFIACFSACSMRIKSVPQPIQGLIAVCN